MAHHLSETNWLRISSENVQGKIRKDFSDSDTSEAVSYFILRIVWEYFWIVLLVLCSYFMSLKGWRLKGPQRRDKYSVLLLYWVSREIVYAHIIFCKYISWHAQNHEITAITILHIAPKLGERRKGKLLLFQYLYYNSLFCKGYFQRIAHINCRFSTKEDKYSKKKTKKTKTCNLTDWEIVFWDRWE